MLVYSEDPKKRKLARLLKELKEKERELGSVNHPDVKKFIKKEISLIQKDINNLSTLN